MTEAREGGWSRPGEDDERHHKDRAMERDTAERRGEGGLVNYSPRSAVAVGGGYQG